MEGVAGLRVYVSQVCKCKVYPSVWVGDNPEVGENEWRAPGWRQIFIIYHLFIILASILTFMFY